LAFFKKICALRPPIYDFFWASGAPIGAHWPAGILAKIFFFFFSAPNFFAHLGAQKLRTEAHTPARSSFLEKKLDLRILAHKIC